MRLVGLSLRNHQFTFTMALLLALFGFTGFLSMPRSEDPFVDLPEGVVTVVIPGASPEDIESLIVDPLEEALSEIEEIDTIESRMELGLGMVRVKWDPGEDTDDIEREVRAALAEVRPQFPSGVIRADFRPFGTRSITVMQVALVSDGAGPHVLAKLARDLKKEILRVPGIKKVDISGEAREIVSVDVDPRRTAHYQTSLDRIITAIRSYNEDLPGGSLDLGERSVSVRTSGDYESLHEIRRTIVGAWEHRPVYLEDVATVKLGADDPTYRTRLNGVDCVYVSYSQKEEFNVVTLNARVRRILDTFRERLPSDVKLEIAFDQARSVDQRINSFVLSLAFGIGLVGLITLLGMHWRPALIVMTAIPISFLIGLGAVDLLGFQLNQMTVVGLVIAVGLLVDNAIVVTEACARLLTPRADPVQAVETATTEVAWAVVSSTATTVLAFAPVLLIPDATGDFIRSMPTTVIVTLLASLLVALTLTPLLSRFLLRPGSHDTRGSRSIDALASRAYLPVARAATSHPVLTLTAAAGLLVSGGLFATRLHVTFFPKADKPMLVVNIYTPEGSSFATTDAATRRVEAVLMDRPEVEEVLTNIGRGNPSIYYNLRRLAQKKNTAQIIARLRGRPGPTALADLVRSVRALLVGVPGARIEVKELEQGPTVDAPVVVRIRGEDLPVLADVAGRVAEQLKSVPGAVNVYNPMSSQNIDLRVEINEDKASLLGVPISSIDHAVRTAISGEVAGTFRDNELDSYDIVVRLQRSDGAAPADGDHDESARVATLQEVYIPTVLGRPVPLRELAAFGLEGGYQFVMHRDFKRMTEVTADTAGRTASEVSADLSRSLRSLHLPRGYSVELGGEAESRAESFSSLKRALLVALVSIFGVLVLQFRSFLQPLIVFTSIPLGIVGAIAGLVLTDNPFSFTAFLGITSLVGIVVNNAILLVDAANAYRARHLDSREAALRAAERRFKPIFITTATTIVGLLPLTLTGGSFWEPMGWAIVVGLLVSTQTTLIVVPVLYTLLGSSRPTTP